MGTRTGWRSVSGRLVLASMFWSAISTAIQTYVITPITNALSALITDALDWGKNLIGNIGKGITGGMGGLGNVLGNVGSSIAGFLGFHSPTKLGPGREADTWAPNLMKMYAQGLTGSIPLLATAASCAATALANGLAGGGTASNSNLALAGGGGGTSTTTINANFPNATNKDEIKAALLELQQDQYRQARRAGSYGSLTRGAY